MAVRDLIRREGHLSTPSLGITVVEYYHPILDWDDETFNSLSRDHTTSANAFAGTASGFQLPLSGSRARQETSARLAAHREDEKLSTPSLGITSRFRMSLSRSAVRLLSTPSLGITVTLYHGRIYSITLHTFQLPLSGSHLHGKECPECGRPFAFNSLSRDHWPIRQIMGICSPEPLPFNSLSRDHISGPVAFRIDSTSKTFNSLSRDHIRFNPFAALYKSLHLTFNSLSRDHRIFSPMVGPWTCFTLSTPSLGIT
jgi:hypothetical protein